MHGDQDCNRVAEVRIHHRAQNAGGQILGLEQSHVEAQLGPELIRIGDRFVQFDVDDHHSIASGRIGLIPANLFEVKQMLFDLARYLVFNLLAGRARIHGGNDAGSDRDLRILAARHPHHGIDTQEEDHGRQEQRYLRVA